MNAISEEARSLTWPLLVLTKKLTESIKRSPYGWFIDIKVATADNFGTIIGTPAIN